MEFSEPIASISVDMLHRTGATKWSQGEDVIGAFVAEMDFGIAAPITQALHDSVDEGTFGYLPHRLLTDMQEATSEMLASKHGWNVDPLDVHCTPDIVTGFLMAMEHHSRPESKIIIPTPTYMPFLFLPAMLGRDVIQVPMIEVEGRYCLDYDGIERAFDTGGKVPIESSIIY